MKRKNNFDVTDNLLVLPEYTWDVNFHFNEELLDLVPTEKEKQVICNLSKYVSRGHLNKQENVFIVIDYTFPVEQFAKQMNELVTSALITQIDIIAKNQYDKEEFTYKCLLKKQTPDWFITFGTQPKNLTLTCTYIVESYKIV